MAAKYFRITAYHPQDDYSVIIDSNGMFEKLWQFSSFLVQKGLKVIEVSNEESFLDINISKAEENSTKLLLRATAKGKPIYKDISLKSTNQEAIVIGDKSYVPKITQ